MLSIPASQVANLRVSNLRAPHLSHMDLSGHGYAVVRAGGDALNVEFV